ncbi:hypothetical protein FAGAP_10401 [Fusarium agapanthi]|uniref:Uncharacterized protein n=1 Tax=Fusarium agapanthi TaxID=1803897 RepID=A0A9P5B0N9_9HYPO|nr:hypothetical protein FAGAP_10401 [Fusarium agapanthi]
MLNIPRMPHTRAQHQRLQRSVLKTDSTDLISCLRLGEALDSTRRQQSPTSSNPNRDARPLQIDRNGSALESRKDRRDKQRRNRLVLHRISTREGKLQLIKSSSLHADDDRGARCPRPLSQERYGQCRVIRTKTFRKPELSSLSFQPVPKSKWLTDYASDWQERSDTA